MFLNLCHDDPGHGTKIMRGKDRYKGSLLLVIYIYEFTSAWCHEMSQHQNCKRYPSTSLHELLSLNFNSLFSSLLLGWSAWDVYIYIDVYSGFCVLLVVLCFHIMYLLSQARSLGRCFKPAGK